MRRKLARYGLMLVLTSAAVLAALRITYVSRIQGPLPAFGRYSEDTTTGYDSWVRTSLYITARDGTKLAADVFRPARGGEPTNEPLPVIWTHTRYGRAHIRNGQLQTILDQAPWLPAMILHGYVIGAVDVRGAGASEGTQQGPFPSEEVTDAYDVTEWLARQPWSNGRIGMFGGSYLGVTQYLAASAAPPHLKAIFPEMSMFDIYDFVYPGGVFRQDFVAHWSQTVKELDTAASIAPVDQDRDGAILKRAIEIHRNSRDVLQMFAPLRYRDSIDPLTATMPHQTRSPASYLDRVKNSHVPIYITSGWFDMWPRDAILWFTNLSNIKHLTLGPWSHAQNPGPQIAAERRRWFDYWLKGLQNGIMEEAPIHYYTIGAPEKTAWRPAWRWPLPETLSTPYYFGEGPSGSIASINDGLLTHDHPDGSGQDDHIVDYTTTTARSTRWVNGYGGPFAYDDLSSNDRKGITYTTPSLSRNVEVTGHPIVHLWMSSTSKDLDVFLYLEEVDEEDYSHYITEGTLRASHRTLSRPPYDTLGLPYRRSFKEDVVELQDAPVELVVDLHPTSNIFDAGHRIRVTVTSADKDNMLTPELYPSPRVTVYRDSLRASHIILPIIPPSSTAALEWPVGLALSALVVTLRWRISRHE